MCIIFRNSMHGVLLLPSLKKQRELIQGSIIITKYIKYYSGLINDATYRAVTENGLSTSLYIKCNLIANRAYTNIGPAYSAKNTVLQLI